MRRDIFLTPDIKHQPHNFLLPHSLTTCSSSKYLTIMYYKVHDLDFTGRIFKDIDFSDWEFKRCNFSNVTFINIVFHGELFSNCVLDMVNIEFKSMLNISHNNLKCP